MLMDPSPQKLFRRGILMFAAIIALQTLWILGAELGRALPRTDPPGRDAQGAASARRSDAIWAARLGLIRGDLWAESALLEAGPSDTGPGKEDSSAPEQKIRVRTAAEKAVSLAPHDARMWLLLAEEAAKSTEADQNMTELLKMAYYTGPNEIELIPKRMILSTNLPAFADADVQQLMRHDILNAITRHPQLKTAVVDAYRNASPTGKQFMEETVRDVDASFLGELRSSGQRR